MTPTAAGKYLLFFLCRTSTKRTSDESSESTLDSREHISEENSIERNLAMNDSVCVDRLYDLASC